MSPPICDHASWLHVAGAGSSLTISDTDRFRQLVEGLPRPHTQRPLLLFFQGKRGGQKDTALHWLFPNNNTKRNRTGGVANIRLDYTSVDTDYPIFFADGNVELQIQPKHVSSMCHRTTTYPIEWPCPNSQTAVDIVLTRIVLPICDAFVVFANDFESSDQILGQLVRWSTLDIFSTTPSSLRPRLVLAYAVSSTSLALHDLRAITSHTFVQSMFPNASIYPLDDRLSPAATFFGLKEHLKKTLDMARESRLKAHWMLSAIHLHGLYESSLYHMSRTIAESFDSIKASRVYASHEGQLQDHISSFLRAGVKYTITYDDTTSYIASSLLMDAYPAGSHLFPPRTMFARLYKNACLTSFLSFYGPGDLATRQCDRVEQKFCANFRTLAQWFQENDEASSSQLHASTCQSTTILWNTLHSKSTCLYCLVRYPQHVLSCGHSVCDVCVMIFGKGVLGEEYKFSVSECILCRSGTLTALLKPPTCGVRVLGIDGGGTRGVVPLEFLLLLQHTLGPECSLRDFFDFAIGTSSGGLIVLSMFLRRWSVEKCSHVFDTIIKQFFSKHQGMPPSLWRRIRDFVKGCIKDGIYSSQDLENCLKETFGTGDMFDQSFSTQSGQKVAVIATPMHVGHARVFSNYNGNGNGYGYERVNDTTMWEAARATTAAPLFFPPMQLDHDVVRDGGLTHNNPVEIALCERRYLWPNATPDIVVSLGTGTSEEPFCVSSPQATRAPKQSQFRCIPDLVRTFLSSIDGERIWHKIMNQLKDEEKMDFFRFNIKIDDTPDINDTSRMDEFKARVHNQPLGNLKRQELISALLISSFYLELDRMPLFENGFYRCEGSLRCRKNAPGVVRALVRLFPNPLEFTCGTGSLGSFKGKEDICSWCQRYSKAVVFYVRHPSDTINICLRTGELQYRRLSSFPKTVEWFIKQQKLDSSFGAANHDAPGSFYCRKCDELRFQRRKRQVHQTVLPPVKRLRIR